MAIYRNPTTNEIDKQEFENHLKTPVYTRPKYTSSEYNYNRQIRFM